MPNVFVPALHQVRATNQSNKKVNTINYDGAFNQYQYVEHDDAASNSALEGTPLGWTTADGGATVTCDFDRTAADQFVGVSIGKLSPTNKFGWALVKSANIQGVEEQSVSGGDDPDGFTQLKIRTNTGVAAGNYLVMTADANGRCVFNGTNTFTAAIVGQAFGADGGTSGDQCSAARIGWV